MKKLINFVFLLIFFSSCSSLVEMVSPDIKILNSYKDISKQSKIIKKSINLNNNFIQENIGSISDPLIFIKKSNGQIGTLRLYPGENVEETWYSADGVTVSLFNGELISTRGLGNDIMYTNIPRSLTFNERLQSPYKKSIHFLTTENKIQVISFSCKMNRTMNNTSIEILEKTHYVTKFTEKCHYDKYQIKNKFWQNFKGVTLKSYQWHNKSDGYISITHLR